MDVSASPSLSWLSFGNRGIGQCSSITCERSSSSARLLFGRHGGGQFATFCASVPSTVTTMFWLLS